MIIFGTFMRIIILFSLLLLSGCGGVNDAVWSACKNQRAEMEAYVAKAKRLGFLVEESGWKARKLEWRALSHSQKVNVAVAVYCTEANSAGQGQIAIYDYHSGEVLASVVDGHYDD